MNKEQIREQFDEMLCWPLGEAYTYMTHDELMEVMEFAFNLGLEVAADNAMIQEEIPEEERDVEIEEYLSIHSGGYIRNEHYVTVNKESILIHKL